MSAVGTILSARLTISSGPSRQGIVFSIHGALSVEAAVNLRGVLDDILNDCDVRDSLTMSIDLHEVEGVDLEGVAGLAAVAKWVDQHGTRVTLIDPSEHLCQALEANGLDGLIRMVRQPPAAVTKMDRSHARRDYSAGRLLLPQMAHAGTPVGL